MACFLIEERHEGLQHEEEIMSKDNCHRPMTFQGVNPGSMNTHVDWVQITGWKREKEEVSFLRDNFLGIAAENVAVSFAGFFKEVMEHAAVLEEEIGNQVAEQFHLGKIKDSCAYGVRLLYRLMVLHGRIPMKQKHFDLNDVLRSIDPFIARIRREDIQFEVDMADNDLPVNGDVRLIKQAVAELLMNASEAVPPGGVITIATRKAEFPYKNYKGCALLSICDTGPGIHDEIRSRIFRPFFTTKPKGSGLGLPLVDHVVRAHNGSMKFVSRKGEGTSVRIYFPLMKSTEKDCDEYRPCISQQESGVENNVL